MHKKTNHFLYVSVALFLLSGCSLESSIYACGEGDGILDCTKDILGWADGICENNKCVVTDCSVGFMFNNNQCESGCPKGEHLVDEFVLKTPQRNVAII